MVLFKSISTFISILLGMIKWILVVLTVFIYYHIFSATWSHRFPGQYRLEAEVVADKNAVAKYQAWLAEGDKNTVMVKALRDWEHQKIGVFNIVGLLCSVPRDQDRRDLDQQKLDLIKRVVGAVPGLDKLGPLESLGEWLIDEGIEAANTAATSGTDYKDQVVLKVKDGTSEICRIPRSPNSTETLDEVLTHIVRQPFHEMSATSHRMIRDFPISYDSQLVVSAVDAFDTRHLPLSEPHKLGSLEIEESDAASLNNQNRIYADPFSEKEESEYYLFYQNLVKSGPNHNSHQWDLDYHVLSKHWASFEVETAVNGERKVVSTGEGHHGGSSDYSKMVEDKVKNEFWSTVLHLDSPPIPDASYSRQIVTRKVPRSDGYVWDWPRWDLFSGVVTHAIGNQPVRIEWVKLKPRGTDKYIKPVYWVDADLLERLSENDRNALILGHVSTAGSTFSKTPPPKTWQEKLFSFTREPTAEELAKQAAERKLEHEKAQRILARWERVGISQGQKKE